MPRTKPPHEPTKATRDTVSLHALVGTPQEIHPVTELASDHLQNLNADVDIQDFLFVTGFKRMTL